MMKARKLKAEDAAAFLSDRMAWLAVDTMPTRHAGDIGGWAVVVHIDGPYPYREDADRAARYFTDELARMLRGDPNHWTGGRP